MSKNEETLVLVADDEPSTLALVTAHVRSKGFKVVEASDGDMAWKLAHEHLPDLVILDVMMPGMSGWEVCRKIRESLPLAHTGVIMLTGIGEHLNEMTSPLYGADTHVDKPFEFSDLDDKIEETLRSRREGAYGRPDHADEISPEDEDTPEQVPAVTQPSPPMSDAMEADVASEPPSMVSVDEDEDDDDDEAPESEEEEVKPKKAPAKKAAKRASAPEEDADEVAPPAKKAAKKAAKKTVKKTAAKKAAKKAVKKTAAKKAAKKAVKKTAAKKVAKKAVRRPTTKKVAKKKASKKSR